MKPQLFTSLKVYKIKYLPKDLFSGLMVAIIPLVQSICDSGDEGVPIAMKAGTPDGQAFIQVAAALVEKTEKRNAELPKTNIVGTVK